MFVVVVGCILITFLGFLLVPLMMLLLLAANQRCVLDPWYDRVVISVLVGGRVNKILNGVLSDCCCC